MDDFDAGHLCIPDLLHEDRHVLAGTERTHTSLSKHDAFALVGYTIAFVMCFQVQAVAASGDQGGIPDRIVRLVVHPQDASALRQLGVGKVGASGGAKVGGDDQQEAEQAFLGEGGGDGLTRAHRARKLKINSTEAAIRAVNVIIIPETLKTNFSFIRLMPCACTQRPISSKAPSPWTTPGCAP